MALANKLKMIKKKAKPRHKAQYQNMQYQVGGVAFTGGKPHYILASKLTFNMYEIEVIHCRILILTYVYIYVGDLN